MAILAVVVLCAVFAPQLAPYDPRDINILDAREPPLTEGHLLGTDLLGRDMLSRLIFGARSSMTVSLTALGVAVAIGTLLGLIAGYVGGGVDRAIMRGTDAVLGFPAILSAMVIVAVLGQGLQNVVLAVVLTTWPRFSRMIRGEVLKLREREFVTFAKVTGIRSSVILRTHILPNVLSVLLIVATLMIAEVILLEAALSFLGLGFAPGDPAWGLMVSEGSQVLRQSWWVSVLPGVAITSVVIAMNYLGDWLGDVLDPNRRPMAVAGVEIPPIEQQVPGGQP
jgi:peptide/nickel transport system permease protein